MVIGTAVCFVLADVALLVAGRPPTTHWPTQTVLGGVIILIAAAMLFQQLTRIDLGIDLPALHAWLADPNPTPGRMASIPRWHLF